MAYPQLAVLKLLLKKEEEVRASEIQLSEDTECSRIAYLLGSYSFQPIHFLIEYENPVEKTKMLTVAVLLPSVVGVGAWHMSVQNGDSVLQIIVSWQALTAADLHAR